MEVTDEQYTQLKELLADYDRTVGNLGKEQAILNTDIVHLERQVAKLQKQLLISDIMIIILVVILIFLVKKKK